MKKILIIGLALIMCMGMVFATDYNVKMSAYVSLDEDGDGDDDGGEPTKDFGDKNFSGFLYYSQGEKDVLGKTAEEVGSAITGIGTPAEGEEFSAGTFDLDGSDTDAADELYLYIGAKASVPFDAKTSSYTVTYSSEGWEYDMSNVEDAESITQPEKIGVNFNTEVQNYDSEEGTTIVVSKGEGGDTEITLAAAPGVNAKPEKILAKTSVTWQENIEDYESTYGAVMSGNWTATVKITITADGGVADVSV